MLNVVKFTHDPWHNGLVWKSIWFLTYETYYGLFSTYYDDSFRSMELKRNLVHILNVISSILNSFQTTVVNMKTKKYYLNPSYYHKLEERPLQMSWSGNLTNCTFWESDQYKIVLQYNFCLFSRSIKVQTHFAKIQNTFVCVSVYSM